MGSPVFTPIDDDCYHRTLSSTKKPDQQSFGRGIENFWLLELDKVLGVGATGGQLYSLGFSSSSEGCLTELGSPEAALRHPVRCVFHASEPAP
jgi:hypothetical protein